MRQGKFCKPWFYLENANRYQRDTTLKNIAGLAKSLLGVK